MVSTVASRDALPMTAARLRRSGSGAAAFSRCASAGWWAREDPNLPPSGYEPLALTIELRALMPFAFRSSSFRFEVAERICRTRYRDLKSAALARRTVPAVLHPHNAANDPVKPPTWLAEPKLADAG